MRGTRSIISSSGPTVKLSEALAACYCCGQPCGKPAPKQLQISFEKHRPGFEHIEDPPNESIRLCLNCAGTIASSIVEFLTSVATQSSKKR